MSGFLFFMRNRNKVRKAEEVGDEVALIAENAGNAYIIAVRELLSAKHNMSVILRLHFQKAVAGQGRGKKRKMQEILWLQPDPV